MDTTVINFFGGPGVGKSTAAAKLFSTMKEQGLSCELVTEFAKELTWAGDRKALHCQPFVTGTQLFRLERLVSKVDYIITDSPLPVGLLYSPLYDTESFEKSVLDWFNWFHNYNILITRKPGKYNQAGRNQNLDEAIAIDKRLLEFLDRNNIKIDETF
jgi:hypothetical protein